MDAAERRERIWQVIASIPPGKVATYGQIAKLADIGNGARQVGRCLRELPSSSTLPWFRVINSQGRIALPDGPSFDRQAAKLAEDGVTLVNGRISLKEYQWRP
ncbi:MAG: MGMT family protein [Pseudomonadota bacterium]